MGTSFLQRILGGVWGIAYHDLVCLYAWVASTCSCTGHMSCLLLTNIFHFTLFQESTAGINAGSKNNGLLHGLCVVTLLVLLMLAWECWSYWDFSISGCSIFTFVHTSVIVVVWHWLLFVSLKSGILFLAFLVFPIQLLQF